MKSPLKFSPVSIYIFGIGGFVISTLVIVVAISTGAPALSTSQIIAALVIFPLFLFLGWLMAQASGSIYNRKVDHPVDTEKLVPGQLYWLNGETWATFIGKNEFTGKFRFRIYGLDNSDDPRSFTNIYPGIVRLYISTVQEVSDQS